MMSLAKPTLLILLIVLAAASTTGCATWDPRDRPYDPDLRRGQTLFDQIPNWDDAAERICAGHLRPEQRRPGQSDRC